MFFVRFWASLKAKLQETLVFKLNILIRFLNTVLQVLMWFFLASIIQPETLGYENVGYFPFVLVGSLALFFASRVTASMQGSYSTDFNSGVFKLVYLSNMNIVYYFFINFFVGLYFDFFFVLIPMIGTYWVLSFFVPAPGIILFNLDILITMILAMLIFVVGQLGFTLMSMGSTTFLKRGDPVSFIIGNLNRFFSGQLFPVSVLPAFLMFLTQILPAAYIVLIWRDALFLGKTIFDGSMNNLMFGAVVVNLIVFVIGLFVFKLGVERAKLEGRWF